MPTCTTRQTVEALREAPRPLFRLLDAQNHFIGFRDQQEVLIYCDRCEVFLLVKAPRRMERHGI